MKEKNKVFISYVREDWWRAEDLYDKLKRAGIDVWMDKYDIAPGQNWKMAITHAIHESKFFLALLSQKSVNKHGYVQREIREAIDLMEEMPPSAIFIIPIRLDPCEPSHDFLRTLNWLDFFPSQPDAVVRLINFLAPLDSSELDVYEVLSNPELILERFKSSKFVKSVALRFKERHSIQYFLENCLRLIPDELKTNNILAQNISTHIKSLAACLELHYFYWCGELDKKTVCHSCSKVGTIIHGLMDSGGEGPEDINYISWCTNCLWAWYWLVPISEPIQEFDYGSNTYQ